jgi:hypothetical protein
MPSEATAVQPVSLVSLEPGVGRMAVSLENTPLRRSAGPDRCSTPPGLWYEDVFTVMSAAPPTVADSTRGPQKLEAALPLTHVLTHFTVHWFDRNEISARFPQIAGFRILCFSLFFFARHGLGFFTGLAELIAPLSAQAYDYAYEARSYGVELGPCGLMPAISIRPVNKRNVDRRAGY